MYAPTFRGLRSGDRPPRPCPRPPLLWRNRGDIDWLNPPQRGELSAPDMTSPGRDLGSRGVEWQKVGSRPVGYDDPRPTSREKRKSAEENSYRQPGRDRRTRYADLPRDGDSDCCRLLRRRP